MPQTEVKRIIRQVLLIRRLVFSQGLFWYAAVGKHKAFLTPGSESSKLLTSRITNICVYLVFHVKLASLKEMYGW